MPFTPAPNPTCIAALFNDIHNAHTLKQSLFGASSEVHIFPAKVDALKWKAWNDFGRCSMGTILAPLNP